MPTTIKTGIEGAVGIRGRKAMGELPIDVLSKLGFEGCEGVQQLKLKTGKSADSRGKGKTAVTQRRFTGQEGGDGQASAPFLRALTSGSGEASTVCFFHLAALDSFSVSRTSCLMKPPGMTEKRGGGEEGGGLFSSSRICFAEARKELSE